MEEKKMCPILSDGNNIVLCRQEKCSWWISPEVYSEEGGCSVRILGKYAQENTNDE